MVSATAATGSAGTMWIKCDHGQINENGNSMKLSTKLTIVSMIAVVTIPPMLINNAGKPAPAWLETTMAVFRQLKDVVVDGTQSFTAKPNPKIYSWRDEKGQMHFSEDAPPAHIKNAELSDAPVLVNVLAPVEVESASGAAKSSDTDFKMPIPLPTTIPVTDIPKLIDDAKNVQKLADERAAALEDI